jgi:PqqD family protein of HPr-rel-A system
VLFNAASGDIHLLNTSALAVIDLLAAAPATVDELRQAAPAIPPQALEDLVASLDRLGLVRPVYQ